MKCKMVLAISILMFPLLGKAQYIADTSVATVRAFAKNYRSIRMPYRQLDSLCEGIYTTVMIRIRHGKVCDSLEFTRSCPPFVKMTFQQNRGIFSNADWKSILPESKGAEDYNVLLPCIINIENTGCYGVFTEKEVAANIKWDIDLQLPEKLPWFLLPAYKVHKLPARH